MDKIDGMTQESGSVESMQSPEHAEFVSGSSPRILQACTHLRICIFRRNDPQYLLEQGEDLHRCLYQSPEAILAARVQKN
jgi:hypothetical protein